MNAPHPSTGLPSAASYDLIVIGGGPAGLGAASIGARAGLSTLVVDENPTPGGQIYRAATTSPLKDQSLLGPEYARGAELVAEARASGAEIVSGATVWSLDRDRLVGISKGGASRLVTGKRVIIATGALERPFPIPGWTLPGVLTVGAGQTVLKSSGLVPQGRVAIAGQGPLIWLYAAQILRAGGALKAILDTSERTNLFAALPHALDFLLSPYALKGLKLMREVKAKVRVIKGVTRLEARGEGKLAELAYEAGGRPGVLALDVLLLHQGVVPHVNLAMAADIKHIWDEVQLCFRPVLDEDGGTSVEGIAIAGDGAGIAGGEAAYERGRLAALAAVRALAPDRLGGLPQRAAVVAALARVTRGRAFLDRLFQPAKAFRVPADETIVCRCEEVSTGDIRQSVNVGATGPNQMKAYRRCGMGPCQGRLCGLTVTEVIADARGKTPAEIGYYRLRAPVKPVSLAEIASIPVDETAVKAVVR